MTYRQRVHKRAAEIGAKVQIATVQGNPRTYDVEVEVEAPAGYVWSCTRDIHAIVAWCFRGPNANYDQLIWKSLWEDMQHGVEPCEIDDCDWCADTAAENHTTEETP